MARWRNVYLPRCVRTSLGANWERVASLTKVDVVLTDGRVKAVIFDGDRAIS